MESENERILVQGAETFGIHLDERAIGAIDRYLKELFRWNEKINLTAIRTERGIILKHFLDSLSVCPYLCEAAFLLDLGSGAGFPGIPLKIVQPSLSVTLLDSVLKKVDFQRHIIRTLGLKGIDALHGRAQGKEILATLQGRFDIVISRAFSDLKTFLLLGHPFLRERGTMVAMKGEGREDESVLASDAREMGYALKEPLVFSLPFSSFKRTILLFEKR